MRDQSQDLNELVKKLRRESFEFEFFQAVIAYKIEGSMKDHPSNIYEISHDVACEVQRYLAHIAKNGNLENFHYVGRHHRGFKCRLFYRGENNEVHARCVWGYQYGKLFREIEQYQPVIPDGYGDWYDVTAEEASQYLDADYDDPDKLYVHDEIIFPSQRR